MRPHIPQGGFFVFKDNKRDLALLCHQLEHSGAELISFPAFGIILAAWGEFRGQGLWSDENGAVAYDMDLTNGPELFKLADIEGAAQSKPGQVLFELYRKFGLDFFDKLRGAFGIALLDGKNGRLFVGTDPYGIRPVVYSHRTNKLVAASRIRHLLLDGEIERAIDPEAIYHYLFFQAICSPVSIYKDIRKLPPGKALCFENESLKELTYYDIRYQPEPSLDESHWITNIPRDVERAVGVYVSLSPPEKTGCFLSGGTDSSSITGFYRKLTGQAPKTFSIGFDEAGYNELDYAHLASRHFGTVQNDYYVTPDNVLSLMDSLTRIYDEPFGNASVVPAYYCARMARDFGIEVLLGGDGGDEIFGGNERYVTNLFFDLYHKVPLAIRKAVLEPTIDCLPQIPFVSKVKSYIKRANLPNPERFFSYNLLAETDPSEIFHSEFLSRIDTDCFINLVRSLYRVPFSANPTDRLLYIDMKLTITDNDLRKVTQMVEATGLRVRYPFLDRDLVDFAAKIPPTLKVKLNKNRYIFKRAMEGFLPQQVISKKKHGMGLPIALWLKKDHALFQLLSDMLLTARPRITEYIQPDYLTKITNLFNDDTTSYYGDNLWLFLMLELWLRENNL